MILSGDIETNPGPVTTRSAKKVPGEVTIKVNSDAEKRREMIKNRRSKNCRPAAPTTEDQPGVVKKKKATGPTKRCNKCKGNIRAGDDYLRCSQCKGSCHKKKNCSKLSKYAIPKLDRKTWKCGQCENRRASERSDNPPEEEMTVAEEDAPQADPEDTAIAPAPEKKTKYKCKKCPVPIRAKHIICKDCKARFHQKSSCCGMTRRQIENLTGQKWTCPDCEEAKVNRRIPDDMETIFKTRDKPDESVEKLIITQWNADSIQSKWEEFKEFVAKHKIDVFLLQETKLGKKNKTPSLPGYTIKRKDRDMYGGGLIIGIRDCIPFKMAHIDLRGEGDSITESMTIEIPTTKGQKLRLTNVYIPPVRTRIEGTTTITPDKWPRQECDCIMGDLNGHSTLWEDREADDRGETILDFLTDSDMACLNDGRTTHTNRASGTETAPDLTLVHTTAIDRFTWEPVEDLGGSDHRPILCTYTSPNRIPKVNHTPIYKWNWKKADWKKFTDMVENQIPIEYHQKSVHKKEMTLRKIIRQAANKHIGMKKQTNHTKAWLTEEIKKAITERNKLKRGPRAPWIAACRSVAETIKAEKKRQWTEFCSELNSTTKEGKVWKTIRNLDGRFPPPNKNEVLTVGEISYTDDRDKANQFKKSYKAVSRIPRNKTDRPLKKEVRKGLQKSTTPPRECEEEISMTELERAIRECKELKAAGSDDIPYDMIKRLGPRAKLFILDLFNNCWTGEEPLPQTWRTAIIKPILKEGKDPKKTVSYRPISLTSCLGKLLEKIVANRLSLFLETNKLLNPNQAGFRQNRNTSDQVLRVVQTATDQIHDRKETSLTLLTFFDYEKAYDKVWREGLLEKMMAMGVPWRFTKYVRGFLSARRTAVEVNGQRSKEFYLNEGLPQGSAISPILFLIFINDIDSDFDLDTLLSLSADDT